MPNPETPRGIPPGPKDAPPRPKDAPPAPTPATPPTTPRAITHGTTDAPPAPVPPTDLVKVRALRMGYAGERRRRPGDVFLIERRFTPNKWTEGVDAGTPLYTRSLSDPAEQAQSQGRLTQSPGHMNPIGANVTVDEAPPVHPHGAHVI